MFDSEYIKSWRLPSMLVYADQYGPNKAWVLALSQLLIVWKIAKSTLKREFDQDNDSPANVYLGKNCFNPIGNSDDEVPEKMKPMIVTCSGGCYSLAYEINGKIMSIQFHQTLERLSEKSKYEQ